MSSFFCQGQHLLNINELVSSLVTAIIVDLIMTNAKKCFKSALHKQKLEDFRSCRRATDPLGKFEELKLSPKSHSDIQIGILNGEFFSICFRITTPDLQR